jgi:hypothetical protein
MKLEYNENRVVRFSGKGFDRYFKVPDTDSLYKAAKEFVADNYNSGLYEGLINDISCWEDKDIEKDLEELNLSKNKLSHDKRISGVLQEEVSRLETMLRLKSSRKMMKDLLLKSLKGDGESALNFIDNRSEHDLEDYDFIILEEIE